MIKALAHLCLVVRDLNKAIDFYHGKLGMGYTFDVRRDGKLFGVYLHVGGRSFLEIGEKEHDDPDGTQSFQHICLEVDDINAAVEALTAKGVECTAPYLGADNSWQSWLKDPDGNTIELHAYTETSRQNAGLE